MKDDSDIMALADGELDERGVRDVEARIARDPNARRKLEGVNELGELVRGHLELSADAVPHKKFDALWREIDKTLERESGPVPVPVRARGGVLRRIGRWFDQHRSHIITGAVSAGAVAALALVLRSPSDGGLATKGGPIDVAPVVHRPTEIESLDTPGGTGTVFRLEDEDGDTTVIWVTPEDSVEGI